jgi:hypothetical protein
MKTRFFGLTLMMLFLVGSTVSAQLSSENTPAPPQPCGQPEATQFDFWLGEWEVLAKDRVVGHNLISRIQGGCTLLEEYTASGGAFEGKSFNYFDSADGRWHQVWVDNSGTRLHLTGGFADGQMVMSGERTVNGKVSTDRISWTDNPDGTVRQLWELSADGGETWQVLFDGLYRHPEKKAEGGDE